MFLNVLTLLTALSVSAIAIYYSVVGLTTIFAASVIPVAIMGTALEVAKLVTAVWLHKHWRNAIWWLKSYLSIAVVVLMFITSMGIFGFLSKSHIEQTAASDEQTAKIESITGTITRGEAKVARLQGEIDKLNSGTADTRVDTLIEREQKELERLTDVVNVEKAVLREAAEKSISSINGQIDTARAAMEAELSNTFFGKDGVRKKFDDTQAEYNTEIQVIRRNLEDDLAKVDTKYAPQFTEVNNRLSKLKEQSEEKTGTIETRITAIETQLTAVQKEVDDARENKAVLESQFRKLEAEVGPVKYIAEFIYSSEADRNLLEEAVRWVIVIIIFVFDPLAVLLLIASQYSFEMRRPAPAAEDLDDAWNNVEVLQPREEATQEKADTLVVKEPAPPKKKKVVRKKKIVNKEPIREDNNEQVDTDQKPNEASNQITEKSVGRISTDEEVQVKLISIGDDYISFNDKNYNRHALRQSFPEFRFDFQHTVDFGPRFPAKVPVGKLFIRSDFLPTTLYRFNGSTWDPQDKNILMATAYSDNYIEHLVNLVGNSDYDPELLNNIEKRKIQEKLINDL